MLRYSLASLFIILLYVSIMCAALVNATGIWPQIAVTLTVGILILFTLAAVCREDQTRRFARGFAITGWIYFLLVSANLINVRYLLTDSVANRLYVAIHSQPQPATSYQVVVRTTATPAGPVTTQTLLPPPSPPPLPAPTPSFAYYTPAAAVTGVDQFSFTTIAHACWAILFALIGGVVAQVMYVRSRKANGNTPEV
jgi:hypothetical protein